jgi:phosphotransferase system enzyme I (PtsI)
MEIKKGIGVSPGVVISTAVVLDAEDLLIPKRSISPDLVETEVKRLDDTIVQAIGDVVALRDTLTSEVGKDIGAILDFHIGVLKDKTVHDQIVSDIRKHHTTAEYSVSVAMRRYAANVAAIKDKYLSERVKDVHDVEKRLLKLLIGQKHEDLAHLTQDVTVIAHDLLPSQTAALNRKFVRGFATDVGGRTSHTAIVARAMGIPAVVGLGNITAEVSGGDLVIIDGTRGVVIVNPDDEQLADYRETGRKYKEGERERQSLSTQPARTLDGYEVSLMANIEFPRDIEDADTHGAQGIGLYRTEFLYLSQEREPTENEHFAAYSEALRRLKGKPLVIRTLDLGADKYTQAQSNNPERNPFLGDRSIRMCLHDIPMFKRQLRAIMRATVLGDVRIMFPMICTLMELRQARMVLEDVKEELEEEGVPFRREIPIGMMVEVPSAALMADQFAKEVNFFSIGTNDLIQYTLAVDRTNERVAGLYCPAHPSVLKLIRDIIRAGRRNTISVSMCGEMAGDPLYTLLLLGLELNTFSMNAPDVPEVKKIIRSTTMEHARHVARRVMSFDSERQVMHFLREETRKIIPDAF